MTGNLVILTTCASAREARRIARALVEERLAACVNIQKASIESIYRWKGKVDQAREVLLQIKTSNRLFPRLERRIRQLHSYQTPEIIALPIAAGSRDYLAWLDESLASKSGKRRKVVR
jgi:periplasmic divalent cation tolerance protein